MKHIHIFMLTLLALCAVSCNQSQQSYDHTTRYLAVQLQGSDKWSLLDVESGEVVVRDRYDLPPSAVVSDMYYVPRVNGTYDYYNIADPDHAINAEPLGSVTLFSNEGLAVCSRRGGPLTVIDKQGHTVKTLPHDVSQCAMFTHGRAAYQDDLGLWGFINEKGDSVVAAQYASVNAFLHDDVALVVNNVQPTDTVATFTIIDKQGGIMFASSSAQYQPLQPFYQDGVLPVIKGDTIVCLDHKGNEVPNPRDDHQAVDTAGYQDYSRTAGGYFLVLKEGKMGLVDKNNKTLIAPTHTQLLDVTPDRYVALDDTIARLVDRNGKDVGKARFVHVHGAADNLYAARGYVDTGVIAGALLTLVSPAGAAGAMPSTTLMDMNALVTGAPESYVGQNGLVVPQGPLAIQYVFDRDIATATPDSTAASFNLDARVRQVALMVRVAHCGLDTEQEIMNRLMSALGTRGFVLDHDGVFTSGNGTALALGYDEGIVNLVYHMSAATATPLPRNKRQ